MIREHPFTPPAAQVGMRRLQFPRELGMACGAFPGKMEQRFEPEIGQIEDLRALLHEPDRQQRFGKRRVGAQFRDDARQPQQIRCHLFRRMAPDASDVEVAHDLKQVAGTTSASPPSSRGVFGDLTSAIMRITSVMIRNFRSRALRRFLGRDGASQLARDFRFKDGHAVDVDYLDYH